MAIRIRDWLAAQGFSAHPFEYWEADREATLSAYFVRPEWFDALMGDPGQPRSAVLFAPRGHGKSSHRLQIARLCGRDASVPALIVPVTEFDWLMIDGLEGVTRQRYLQYLVRCTLTGLWEGIQHSPARYAALAAEPLRLVRIYGMLDWATGGHVPGLPPLDLPAETLRDLARQLRCQLPEHHDSEPLIRVVSEACRHLQQADVLHDLVDLVQAARYASIYVLVDRVDENEVTEHNPDAAVRLIQPLISNLHLIEYPGIAVKFFLPEHMHAPLIERRISRIADRLPTYALHWNDADLHELLHLRLQAFSRVTSVSAVARVNRFQDLCEPGTNADQRLIAAAQGSPRELIKLAASLIEFHCQRAGDVTDRISQATLDAYLPARLVPRLRLDVSGDIYIGGVLQRISLTPVPRRLLQLLWDNRPRMLPITTILDQLYDDDQTEDALRKVVGRLRAQLEPASANAHGVSNSRCYIDWVKGHGLRLLNTEEAT